MSNVSTQVIQSMFNHLTASYTEDEAREILSQKYPDEKVRIYEMGKLVNGPVEVSLDEEVEQSDTEKLATAVKQKTTKTKAPKAPKAAKAPKAPAAPKEKKVSKMDRARELYAEATDKSRKAMIEVFGKELGLSAAAASTYYYTVKG